MFVRFRWFLIGALTSFGLFTYLAAQLRRAREAMTVENLARGGARGVAGVLETAADRVAPDDH